MLQKASNCLNKRGGTYAAYYRVYYSIFTQTKNSSVTSPEQIDTFLWTMTFDYTDFTSLFRPKLAILRKVQNYGPKYASIKELS